jgi:hypothetical protein
VRGAAGARHVRGKGEHAITSRLMAMRDMDGAPALYIYGVGGNPNALGLHWLIMWPRARCMSRILFEGR